MSDPYLRNLCRECVAFGLGLVLVGVVFSLLGGRHGPGLFTTDFWGPILGFGLISGFIATPFFLLNVLFVWPVLHGRISRPLRVAVELLLLCIGWVIFNYLLHRGQGNVLGIAVQSLSPVLIIYAFYRANAWTIEWLATVGSPKEGL